MELFLKVSKTTLEMEKKTPIAFIIKWEVVKKGKAILTRRKSVQSMFTLTGKKSVPVSAPSLNKRNKSFWTLHR